MPAVSMDVESPPAAPSSSSSGSSSSSRSHLRGGSSGSKSGTRAALSSSSSDDAHQRPSGRSGGETMVRPWSSLGTYGSAGTEFDDVVRSYHTERGRDVTDVKDGDRRTWVAYVDEKRQQLGYALREYTSYIAPGLLWDSRPPVQRMRARDYEAETQSTYLYRGLLVLGLVAVLSVGYAGNTAFSAVQSSGAAGTSAIYSEDGPMASSSSSSSSSSAEATKEAEPSKAFHSFQTQLSTTGIHVTLPVQHNPPPLNDGLYAEVTNEYSGSGTTMFAYPFLSDAILMEPYRDATVTLKGFTPGCNIMWTLTGITYPSIVLTETVEASEDGVFIVQPQQTGQYIFHVESTCGDAGEVQGQLTQAVWVKYVRREISTLTDDDREEFLTAFRTLWDVTTRDGMDMYNKLFKSLNYFAAINNDASANPICDEFDAGTGFLNNHIYMGMYLEQSLRQINPKVSLHYMDYSKYFETELFTKHVTSPMDGGNWTDIFSEKWFGKNNPWNGVIMDSRWAYSKVPFVTTEFLNSEMIMDKSTFFPLEETEWMKKTGPHIMSPYGYLRAPWNYNPSPYTTRYNNVNRLDPRDVPPDVMKPYMGSTCADIKSLFEASAVGQPLYVFLEGTEDAVHVAVHNTIGGSGGDPAAGIDQQLRDTYGLSNTHMFYIAESSHKFVKAYLSNKDIGFENPLVCVGTPWVNGKLTTSAHPRETGGPSCECNPLYLESEDKVDQLIDMYFGTTMPEEDSIKSKDFDTKKEIMRLACERMSYEGDLSGSGAALDPVFWVINGAVDRLYQRVRFANVLSDTLYKTSKRNIGCSGHEATGSKKWLKGFMLEDKTIDTSQMNNQQLAEVLDPTTDMFRDLQNSLYDSADYPWCAGLSGWLNEADPDGGDEANGGGGSNGGGDNGGGGGEDANGGKKKGGSHGDVMKSTYDAIESAGTAVWNGVSTLFQSSRFFS